MRTIIFTTLSLVVFTFCLIQAPIHGRPTEAVHFYEITQSVAEQVLEAALPWLEDQLNDDLTVDDALGLWSDAVVRIYYEGSQGGYDYFRVGIDGGVGTIVGIEDSGM